MDGWNLYDQKTEWGEYGAWSGWSQNAVSGSDARQVETRAAAAAYATTYKYNRYLYYMNGVAWSSYTDQTGTGVAGNWEYIELDYALSPKKVVDGRQAYGSYGNVNRDLWWNQSTGQKQTGGAYTEYRYRDRSQQITYYFERWSDWSAWQDDAVNAGSDRQVETRTVYRYREQ
jgi:hypothetical protein